MAVIETRLRRLEAQIGVGGTISSLTDEELDALFERKSMEAFGRLPTPEECEEVLRQHRQTQQRWRSN